MNRLNLILGLTLGLTLGLILPPSFALQSHANDSVREAIEKAIPYEQRQDACLIDEKDCVSYHHLGHMLWCLKTARSKGLTVSSRLDEWTSWAIDKSISKRDDGGWEWILNQESDALATGMVLYALKQSGMDPKQERISKAVEFLTSSQNDDGLWYVKGPRKIVSKRPRPTGERHGPSSHYLNSLLSPHNQQVYLQQSRQLS